MDYVPTTVLKSAVDVFGYLIANLANLSFAEGHVTSLLNKPGASTENMTNYQLITNLNTISKILERLAVEHMRELAKWRTRQTSAHCIWHTGHCIPLRWP